MLKSYNFALRYPNADIMTKDTAENLKIGVRIRPMKVAEEAQKYERVLQAVDNKMIILYEHVSKKLDALRQNRKKEHRFAYDLVFSEKDTQEDVYEETTKQLIPFVLGGFNATVFAYGPTGTGKTFTMVGTHNQPGIMVMALNDLFYIMQKGNEKFTVSMSYLEIYNEQIRDLLVSNSKTLDLREDPHSGVMQVAGLTQISTTSTDEVMKLLHKGNKRRKCEETAANKTSSRSHALLQINVRLSSHSKSMVGEQVKIGRLFMADLAGSERARKTQNVGLRLTEGAHINKSLLALGNVINALAEGNSKFVNFRDSKLTRLLKDALTGNSKTVMIAHVSPACAHREESRNTLIYADKAKNIPTKYGQNKVDVLYHVSQYHAIISELKEEISRLKSKLDHSADSSNANRLNNRNKGKVESLKFELIEAFNEQMMLRKQLMQIDNSLVAMSMEFETQNAVIQEYENERKSKRRGRRCSSGMDGSSESIDEEEDEPEEILEAWEDLVYIHNEQKRYTEMKDAIAEELEKKKERCAEIEELLEKEHQAQCQSDIRTYPFNATDESLPKETTCDEQRELLALLCKVHELEIHQAEMETLAILKEHDLKRRNMCLMRYERQMNICDKIITKQRNMLLDSNSTPNQELEELYSLYQLESQFTNNLVHSSSISNVTTRSNSVISLRPDKLPPINRDSERLFKPGRRPSLNEERKPSTPLKISSPLSSRGSARTPTLPRINQRSNSFASLKSLPMSLRPWSAESSTVTQVYIRRKKKKKKSPEDHLPPLK